jgi:hypothetical protein
VEITSGASKRKYFPIRGGLCTSGFPAGELTRDLASY